MRIDELVLEARNINNLKSNFHETGNEKIKIGIMGGTFDPIHYAHLATAEYIRETYNLDKILFIPNGNPPHKSKLRTNKIDRYNMVLLATMNNDNFAVSDMEINRESRTYTIDTLKELHKKYKNANIYFITGFDAICDMESWKDVSENFELATFIAANRPGISSLEAKEKIENLKIKYNANIRSVNVPSLDISSTYIRKHIKDGKSIKYLIPENVETYIYEKNIYTNGDE
ncbi:MAG: nicotinate-nucleotide adenylyltransferase [Paeniclostridium sordellii]|uniref:Probable nicotinate-nucleotide adenylyltransferase n=1 Tax=Paeniclostridium hominis TaxID=2764329 RepID=A0ABR7JZM0_9FIRM|nr:MULTISPECIES: nicotinate-nucleotide adenylyltransferase [Paeniclostridium]MBC6002253.1 nicotinate-nucleotide adenylyltransferase [Paeniclostridium hominis]MDU2591050.1 nicotinate-nucleotide adenylyltransferase [Paeniclostridium sordellii]